MRLCRILTAIAVLFLVACKSTTPPSTPTANQPPPVQYEQGPQAPAVGPRTFTPGVPVAPIQHNPFTLTTNDPAVTVPVKQPVSITTTNQTAMRVSGLISQTNSINGAINPASVADLLGLTFDPTGINDSSAAIQAAVNIASSNAVLLIPGTYKCSNVLITNSVKVTGYGAILKSTPLADGTSRSIFTCRSNAVTLVFEGLTFDGSGSTTGNTGETNAQPLVWCDNAATVEFTGCTFINHASGNSGIPAALKDRLVACAVFRNCGFVTFHSCAIHDNWNEQLWVYNSPNSTNFSGFYDCKSYNGTNNPSLTPISITGGRAEIKGCVLRNSNGSVINVQRTSSFIMDGNQIIGQTGDGYGVNVSHDGGMGYTDNVNITRNYFEGTYEGAVSGMGNNYQITGNILVRPGAFGIKFQPFYDPVACAALLPDYPVVVHQNLTNLLVSGNTIVDVNYSAIYGVGAGMYVLHTDPGYCIDGVSVVDNAIQILNGTNVMQRCLVIGQVSNVVVRANQFRSWTERAVWVPYGPFCNASISHNTFYSTNSTRTNDFSFQPLAATYLAADRITFSENTFLGATNTGCYHVYLDTLLPTNWRFINNAGLDYYSIFGVDSLYFQQATDVLNVIGGEDVATFIRKMNSTNLLVGMTLKGDIEGPSFVPVGNGGQAWHFWSAGDRQLYIDGIGSGSSSNSSLTVNIGGTFYRLGISNGIAVLNP